MIIRPTARGYICTSAHPEGCAQNVREQIAYVQARGPMSNGPQKALIIGASTGYGLSSRIEAAFGYGAQTLGVFFEKPASDKRTATAGWYNTAAFETEANKAGLKAWSLNGDAYSDEIKQKTIDLIKKEMGSVDLVVYSLASPRRFHPKTGQVFSSVLKPIGKPYHNKSINLMNAQVTHITIDPATQDEIDNTVAVMGGEDWKLWMDALSAAGVLSKGVVTVAYSYIGPDVTNSIYREGTIGRAKDHLEATAKELDGVLSKIGGRAVVSINKALVTQASAAIPVVPLYISILFKFMKAKGLHEGCIQQMHRLFVDHLFSRQPKPLDEKGRIRIDDWEMRSDIQTEVAKVWSIVETATVPTLTDYDGFHEDFFRLFGFNVPGVNYEADVNPEVPIESLKNHSLTI